VKYKATSAPWNHTYVSVHSIIPGLGTTLLTPPSPSDECSETQFPQKRLFICEMSTGSPLYSTWLHSQVLSRCHLFGTQLAHHLGSPFLWSEGSETFSEDSDSLQSHWKLEILDRACVTDRQTHTCQHTMKWICTMRQGQR
jgi:hypothetical protein